MACHLTASAACVGHASAAASWLRAAACLETRALPSAWLRFALAAPQLASTDPVGLCECACLEVSQLIVRGPTAAWRSCSMASMVSSPEGRPRAPKRWLWTRPSCSRAALAARSAWPTTSAGSCILANCMCGTCGGHVLSTYLLSGCSVGMTATHARYLNGNHLACRHACSRGDGLGSHSIRAINVTQPDCPSSANVLAANRESTSRGKQAVRWVSESLGTACVVLHVHIHNVHIFVCQGGHTQRQHLAKGTKDLPSASTEREQPPLSIMLAPVSVYLQQQVLLEHLRRAATQSNSGGDVDSASNGRWFTQDLDMSGQPLVCSSRAREVGVHRVGGCRLPPLCPSVGACQRIASIAVSKQAHIAVRVLFSTHIASSNNASYLPLTLAVAAPPPPPPRVSMAGVSSTSAGSGSALFICRSPRTGSAARARTPGTRPAPSPPLESRVIARLPGDAALASASEACT